MGRRFTDDRSEPEFYRQAETEAVNMKHAVAICSAIAIAAADAFAGEANDRRSMFVSILDDLADAASLEPRLIAPEPHPFTIEPGRFSIEFTPLHYTRDRDNDARVRSWSMPFTFKAGILNNLDIHIGLDPILHDREHDRELGTRTISRGFGDVILRTKYNVWGNDELKHATAVSLMPFMHTATEKVDGSRPIDVGLLVPMAWFGWRGWDGLDIEFTPGFAAVRGIDTNKHVFEFSSQLVFNQELTKGIIPFFEFGAAVTSERGQGWAGVVGVGVTFEPTDDLVIEPAVHFGVTDAADDLVVSLTFVLRF